MLLLQSLRHGAGSAASRFPKNTVFTSGKLDCYLPVAKQTSTLSLANRQLQQYPRPSASSPSRPSIQQERLWRLFDRQARCISLEAPREPLAGSEPGINIKDESAWPEWRKTVQSQITAVDFSKDRIERYELNNSTLEEFLAKPREDWVTCRWINGM